MNMSMAIGSEEASSLIFARSNCWWIEASLYSWSMLVRVWPGSLFSSLPSSEALVAWTADIFPRVYVSEKQMAMTVKSSSSGFVSGLVVYSLERAYGA